MNPEKDAYGQEVWAYFNGSKSYEIVERDDGYFDISGGSGDYFAEYKDWPEQQRKALKAARGRILDVGCGSGRIAMYFQRRGFYVAGIDNSPLAIKVCKLRGLKNAKVMSITSVGKFKAGLFNAILMMGNNFGLFGSFKRARWLLKKFHKITSPKAVIIAETLDPYKTDDLVHLAYHKFNRKRGRMGGQIRIRIRFKMYVGDWFDYLFVSKDEMKKILEGTGWKVKKFVDARSKHSYVAIIEKV